MTEQRLPGRKVYERGIVKEAQHIKKKLILITLPGFCWVTAATCNLISNLILRFTTEGLQEINPTIQAFMHLTNLILSK